MFFTSAKIYILHIYYILWLFSKNQIEIRESFGHGPTWVEEQVNNDSGHKTSNRKTQHDVMESSLSIEKYG